jgi:hypothetical protein
LGAQQHLSVDSTGIKLKEVQACILSKLAGGVPSSAVDVKGAVDRVLVLLVPGLGPTEYMGWAAALPALANRCLLLTFATMHSATALMTSQHVLHMPTGAYSCYLLPPHPRPPKALVSKHAFAPCSFQLVGPLVLCDVIGVMAELMGSRHAFAPCPMHWLSGVCS